MYVTWPHRYHDVGELPSAINRQVATNFHGNFLICWWTLLMSPLTVLKKRVKGVSVTVQKCIQRLKSFSRSVSKFQNEQIYLFHIKMGQWPYTFYTFTSSQHLFLPPVWFSHTLKHLTTLQFKTLNKRPSRITPIIRSLVLRPAPLPQDVTVKLVSQLL